MNKEQLHNFIEANQPNICQVVAYKDGEKIYSDCWNNYKEDDCVHIMSATKSIMAPCPPCLREGEKYFADSGELIYAGCEMLSKIF